MKYKKYTKISDDYLKEFDDKKEIRNLIRERNFVYNWKTGKNIDTSKMKCLKTTINFGRDADDFIKNLVTVVVDQHLVKRPRIADEKIITRNPSKLVLYMRFSKKLDKDFPKRKQTFSRS